MIASRLWPAGLLLVAAACAPTPSPKPAAAPAPAKALPPPPAATDWRDQPETPGGWSYAQTEAGSTASFGQAGTAPAFMIRCDRAKREVILSRLGGAGAISVTTSYAPMRWPAQPIAGGRSGVALAARDPFLDRIAFSRGRFSVEAPGLPTLVLPAWAEPARVIEDCRL